MMIWLATEVGEEPEDQREAYAEDKASDDGKIKGGVFAAVDDVAGKAAESERQAPAKIEQDTDGNEEGAQDEHGAAEFPQRIHGRKFMPSGEGYKGTVRARDDAIQRAVLGGGAGGISPAKSYLSRRELNELVAGKEVAYFKRGGFRSVRAVSAVIPNVAAEVTTNGAWRGLFGIGRPHGVAPFQDRTISFEDESNNFSRTHEVSELTEEWPLYMDRVKTASFLFCETQSFNGHNFESRFLNAGEYFALKAARHGVRLDDGKCTFECHERSLPKIN